MGSSYRSDLNRGELPVLSGKLKEASNLIGESIKEVFELISDETQYDNAGDTGGLAEKLSLAKRLIDEELPESAEVIKEYLFYYLDEYSPYYNGITTIGYSTGKTPEEAWKKLMLSVNNLKYFPENISDHVYHFELRNLHIKRLAI